MQNILFLTIVLTLLSNAQCQYSYYWKDPTSSTIAIISSAVSGGVLITAGLVILIVKMCNISKRRLKKRYNIIDVKSMTPEAYEKRKNRILAGLNSAKINQVFSQFSTKGSHFITIIDVQSKEEKPFLTEVKIKGVDELGEWVSQGYILCKDFSMFFWMQKTYKNGLIFTDANKKVKYIVYESTTFDQVTGVISGVWFFEKFQFDPTCRGAWSLLCPPNVNQLPTNLPLETQTNLVAENTNTNGVQMERMY